MKQRLRWTSLGLALLCIWPLAHAADGVPQRIVSLSPHTTEMAAALGLFDHLVAVSERSDYPAEALTLPTVSGYAGIDVEKVIALQPDLVLAWPGGNPPVALEQLRQFGVPMFNSDPKTPEDILRELLALGERTGQQARAQALVTTLQQRLDRLDATYHGRQPHPQVFYELWRQPLMTSGKRGWLTPLLARCGADNLFADVDLPYPQVELEKLLSRDPDVIIVGDNTPDWWWQWTQLKAVRNQHVVAIAPELLQRMGPRLIDGLEALCQAVWQPTPAPVTSAKE